MSLLGDRRFVARAGWALLVAQVRYWSTVAPLVRHEMARWERIALEIEDRELRALAIEKIRRESFHAEAAAMLATRAPRAHRGSAVRAIVALQLLFDYLDGLTERPSIDPLGEGERMFRAYTDALSPGCTQALTDHLEPSGSYLRALSGATEQALGELPSSWAIRAIARQNAVRGAQAQIRMHATTQLGTEQLKRWALAEADGSELQWRELLAASASSVLAIHALVVAAADPETTPEEATLIESAYLSTCALLTLLDGVVDHDEDHGSGAVERIGYIGLYEDAADLAGALSSAAERSARHAHTLRDGPHHAMALVGAVAYYTTAPGAGGAFAAPIAKQVQRQLAPLISATLMLMRVWRLAKRIGNRRSEAFNPMASPTAEITHI